MADDPDNTLAPATQGASAKVGDIPDHLRRRYLLDPKGGPGLGFYVDTTVTVAAFRDHGGVLAVTRTEPQVVRDIVAIARHRGWTVVRLDGAKDFRREAWMTASAAGLEVRGYRPTERDRQALVRRLEAQSARRIRPDASDRARAPQSPDSPGPAARLKIVEAVVRDRIADPAAQATVMAAARGRVADWLDRGARFTDIPPLDRPAPQREPGRERR